MSSDRQMEFDVERIIAETFVANVHFHEVVDSTNSAALAHCQNDCPQVPLLVVASEQSAGRGRGANQWWSARGALTFSLVIRPTELGLAEQMWPKASLTTGLSVCLALDELLPGDEVTLKWPNDVFLRRRKICGVLIEVGPRSSETLVVGIGVNVNNSFDTAPHPLPSIATSLLDATGRRFPLDEVLIRVLKHLEVQLDRLSRDDAMLAAQWQRRCALDGRTIEIDTGKGQKRGVCQGIDQDGALLLLTDAGTERFFGGVVARIW